MISTASHLSTYHQCGIHDIKPPTPELRKKILMLPTVSGAHKHTVIDGEILLRLRMY